MSVSSCGRCTAVSTLFHQFHVLLSGFLIGQRFHVFIRFNYRSFDFLGKRKGLFHISDQFIVISFLSFVFKVQFGVDVYVSQRYTRYSVSFINAYRNLVTLNGSR